MKINKLFLICTLFFMYIFFIGNLVLADHGGAHTFSGYASGGAYITKNQFQPSFQTYYGGRVSEYWPILGDREGQEQCEARQDLLIQVAPAGCQPVVVRSDLLAEQNVPVFCQLDAFKLNPLIDINEIRSIRFRASYPKEVIGAGFHPARAALRTKDKLLGSPLTSNIGYAVVILRKNVNESSLPGFVNLTLSAQVEYNSGNALGIGKAEFLLTEVDNEKWQNEESNRQSFWQGRYSLRLEHAEPGIADIAIYRGDRKISGTRAELGKISRTIYLPGSYCKAGLQVAYDGFIGPGPTARLEIGDAYSLDVLNVQEGSSILDNRCRIIKINIDPKTGTTGSVRIQCSYASGVELSLRKKDNSTKEKSSKITEESIKNKFKEAINAYEKVAEEYPSDKEKDELGKDSLEKPLYGQRALEAAIKLAEEYGEEYEEARLIKKLLSIYPAIANKQYYQKRLEDLDIYDTTLSSGVLYLDGKHRTIRLVNLENPSEKSFANFFIDESKSSAKISLKEEYKIKGGRIILDELTPETAKLSAYCSKENTKTSEGKRETHILRLNDLSKDICNTRIKIDAINTKKVAKVRLIPFAIGTRSEVNVSLGIGIEKRAIKLSPDKTKERVANLNKSIERFEKITKNLGNGVSALKAACFATAGVLTVKNFLTGLNGESIARQQVMRGEFGWTKKCEELVNTEKKYSTLNDCYLGESTNINKDVRAKAESIKKVNEKIKIIEKDKINSKGLLGERSIDTSKAAKEYAQYLLKEYKGEKIGETPIEQLIKEDCYEKFECDYTMLRNIEESILSKRAGVSQHIQNNINQELSIYEKKILGNRKLNEDKVEIEKLRQLGLGYPTELSPKNQKTIIGDIQELDKADKFKAALTKGENNSNLKHSLTFTVPPSVTSSGKKFEGGTYVAGLQENTNERYTISSLVRVDREANNVEEFNKDAISEFSSQYHIGIIVPQSKVSYSNRYSNPKVRYHSQEPYKGMPAIVPIDTSKGWYAATKQTLPAFSGRGAFESSGRVASFWLCNVGKNTREQFHESNFGDDLCQLIDLNTGQSLGDFQGLGQQETRELINKATRALTDAASEYGNKKVKIGYEVFDADIAPNIPETQCQDFMDPKDCHLLFNVCDPVICPSSRCDFGGNYPVANVVETGIIGSTLLCLPNIQEKILLPVCLTGIHAGLDSYTSILKSHRDCLQENLATGKTIGICDQITSIYMCEFFWRQGAPLAKILLPKLIELAATGRQGGRGGGEYLTVSSAWNNMQSSINFFTQNYAVNSLKAYRIRSVEEAGTQICKAFISAQVPTEFKTLVQPDSPPQFSAWFSSARYTDATVPATAQYKVFYHIFAGKDSGVYYRVYLKNPPETGYYYSSPIIPVATGFITKGEFKTETRDFTAPEGYQELCVDINGDERCGFKQVSTSFAVNYVRDKVVQNELEKTDINSEKECIGGSPSLEGAAGSLLTNTNPQSALEESAFPQIYSRGIVRICATDNPGKSTDSRRYEDVGNCGNERVRCWLDKKSIDRAITPENLGVKNETLREFEKRETNRLERSNLLLNPDSINSNLKELEKQISDLKSQVDKKQINVNDIEKKVSEKLKEIDVLFTPSLDKLVLNHHKAEVLLRKAELLGLLAKAYLNNNAQATTPPLSTNNLIAPKEPEKKEEQIQEPIREPKQEKKEEPKEILTLKDYDSKKEIYIFLNEIETNFYLKGTRVYLKGVSGNEEIGVIVNNGIKIYEDKKRSLDNYYNLINNTEIKEVQNEEGRKEWHLEKIKESEVPSAGRGDVDIMKSK